MATSDSDSVSATIFALDLINSSLKDDPLVSTYYCMVCGKRAWFQMGLNLCSTHSWNCVKEYSRIHHDDDSLEAQTLTALRQFAREYVAAKKQDCPKTTSTLPFNFPSTIYIEEGGCTMMAVLDEDKTCPKNISNPPAGWPCDQDVVAKARSDLTFCDIQPSQISNPLPSHSRLPSIPEAAELSAQFHAETDDLYPPFE